MRVHTYTYIYIIHVIGLPKSECACARRPKTIGGGEVAAVYNTICAARGYRCESEIGALAATTLIVARAKKRIITYNNNTPKKSGRRRRAACVLARYVPATYTSPSADDDVFSAHPCSRGESLISPVSSDPITAALYCCTHGRPSARSVGTSL